MSENANLDSESVAEMQRNQCIFCKIITGEIPSKKVYEDSDSIVILDINPANEGHCLILPKKHYQIMPQVSAKELASLFIVAKKVSHAILRGLSASGTSVFVANGAVAGQKAPHFIIHVMPRKEGDSLFNIPKTNASNAELEKIRVVLSTKLGYKESAPKLESKQNIPKLENKNLPVEKEAEEVIEEEKEDILTEENAADEDIDTKKASLEGMLSKSISQEKEDNIPKEDKQNDKPKDKVDIDSISKLFT